ncbi:hypothetical protein [Piscirickettsia salmonis]|nr:hypothetical protein [Piscirickettsia salmonis]
MAHEGWFQRLCRKLLVSELMGKNLKLSKRLREHLHPGRFLIRQLKKGK